MSMDDVSRDKNLILQISDELLPPETHIKCEVSMTSRRTFKFLLNFVSLWG